MFSSGSFIVFGLKFRSFIHFEFIFVYVRECSDFILSHIAVPTALTEETFFFLLYVLASFVMD